MADKLDDALRECGFVLDGSGVAKLNRAAVEVEQGPMGIFYVRLKFENGKTLLTTFDWDDVEDAFGGDTP